VAGAIVRVQASPDSVTTDDLGKFEMTGLKPGSKYVISAWKDGYYASKADDVIAPSSNLRIGLMRYQTDDNPEYEWLDPSAEGSCITCHPVLTAMWLGNDAHAKAAENPRFLTMYNGTDVEGNRSPLTRRLYRKDYGVVPLPPDPILPKPHCS
jgi:hypothetical protein